MMAQTFGTVGRDYPIQPDDINTMVTHVEAFGDDVSNTSALFIVSFCQEKKGWVSFTQAEINAFAAQHGSAIAFDFGKLVENGFILQDGIVFEVTRTFVDTCYDKSPSTTGPASRAARARESIP
jgi:hypothetical protein